jgi:hypothetical protein
MAQESMEGAETALIGKSDEILIFDNYRQITLPLFILQISCRIRFRG